MDKRLFSFLFIKRAKNKIKKTDFVGYDDSIFVLRKKKRQKENEQTKKKHLLLVVV